jgi:hypothetical protein
MTGIQHKGGFMAFLKVIFPVDEKDVLIDGKPKGKTNVAFEIEDGTHTVSIAPPPACDPAQCEVILKPNETGPLSPREVPFAKV